MVFLIVIVLNSFSAQSQEKTAIVIVKSGLSDNRISVVWRNALITRMSRQKLDSMSSIQRSLTKEELDWVSLIESRSHQWNVLRDSLKVPFGGIQIADTVEVLLGAFGVDDGFTHQLNTVCFDVTALTINYGLAFEAKNKSLIDRLYAHEFTHLIHKTWFRENDWKLNTFKDSVLWECLYEGIGMYRSLSEKWFPHNGVFPENTQNVLRALYPQFVDNLIKVESSTHLSSEEKLRIVKNLSRGPVPMKWGALPVAMWLALEADGDDTKLIKWINTGPNSVIDLAKKFLQGNDLERIENVFH